MTEKRSIIASINSKITAARLADLTKQLGRSVTKEDLQPFVELVVGDRTSPAECFTWLNEIGMAFNQEEEAFRQLQDQLADGVHEQAAAAFEAQREKGVGIQNTKIESLRGQREQLAAVVANEAEALGTLAALGVEIEAYDRQIDALVKQREVVEAEALKLQESLAMAQQADALVKDIDAGIAQCEGIRDDLAKAANPYAGAAEAPEPPKAPMPPPVMNLLAKVLQSLTT